jgi:hypothetical protein
MNPHLEVLAHFKTLTLEMMQGPLSTAIHKEEWTRLYSFLTSCGLKEQVNKFLFERMLATSVEKDMLKE